MKTSVFHEPWFSRLFSILQLHDSWLSESFSRRWHESVCLLPSLRLLYPLLSLFRAIRYAQITKT